MKNGWEKLLSRKVSEETRSRIFDSADKLMGEIQAESSPSLLERLLSPMGNLALGGVGALVLLLALYKPGSLGEENGAADAEMIGNVEMLMELETLENWDLSTTKVNKRWLKNPT